MVRDFRLYTCTVITIDKRENKRAGKFERILSGIDVCGHIHKTLEDDVLRVFYEETEDWEVMHEIFNTNNVSVAFKKKALVPVLDVIPERVLIDYFGDVED